MAPAEYCPLTRKGNCRRTICLFNFKYKDYGYSHCLPLIYKSYCGGLFCLLSLSKQSPAGYKPALSAFVDPLHELHSQKSPLWVISNSVFGPALILIPLIRLPVSLIPYHEYFICCAPASGTCIHYYNGIDRILSIERYFILAPIFFIARCIADAQYIPIQFVPASHRKMLCWNFRNKLTILHKCDSRCVTAFISDSPMTHNVWQRRAERNGDQWQCKSA